MAKLTNAIIAAAIDGFEARKQRLDIQITELRALLSGSPVAAIAEKPAIPAKRKVSAAALKRMREGQQRRWAKVRGETVTDAPVKKAAKVKRKMSAAGRANIVAALKKRWAAKKKVA